MVDPPVHFSRRSSDNPHPGLSHQTFIIVVACAAVGGLILVIFLYRAVRSCRSRNIAPLPPIQPLAHHREHQLAQFEASLRAQTYDPSFLAAPAPLRSPLDSPSSRGSNISLLGSFSSPNTTYTPTGEGSEELGNLTPLEPSTPLAVPHPSFSSSIPGSSSSVNLSDGPMQIDATNGGPWASASTSAPSSPSKHSKSLSRLNRDEQSRPHHHRPLSLASSLSRINSRRGLPHGPHSQLQIILPAPLAPEVAANTTLPSLLESASVADRTSMVDRWIPAGRDSICALTINIYCSCRNANRVLVDASTTHELYSASASSLAPPQTPRRASSNPNGYIMSNSQINQRPYPSLTSLSSHAEREYPPPVPRVPSIYEKGEGNRKDERDRRRKLSKSRVE